MKNKRNLSNKGDESIDIETSAQQEKESLIESSSEHDQKPSGVSSTSVQVLILLAVQTDARAAILDVLEVIVSFLQI